jgi:putative membrane protein
MGKPLTPADQERIASAVAQAEARTSGEILCVVTEEVSDYRETVLAWAAGAALLLPPLVFAMGVQPLSITEALGGWSIAHSPGAEARMGLALTLYAAAQAVLFVAVALIVGIPKVRRRLTPGFLKERRVGRAAMEQFAVMSRHLAPGQTGVLIFASVEDRRIEIVADAAAHAEIGDAAWDSVIAEAVAEMRARGPGDGMVRAVQLAGELMARLFPDDGRPSALPDRPLQV